jgi:hypothetical protein
MAEHYQIYMCTDKKENQIFLIYKEIQSGAVTKNCNIMRKGFLICEEMRKYFPIYEEALLNFLIYEENFIFFFISVSDCERCRIAAA